MKTAVRLDRREWADIASRFHQAEAITRRIESALITTTHTRYHSRWLRLANALDLASRDLAALTGRPLGSPVRERTSYEWSSPPGPVKRALTLAEWSEVAEDARRLHDDLVETALAVRPLDERQAENWYRLAARVEVLRQQLGRLAYSQTYDPALTDLLNSGASLMASTHRSTWKARERQAAALFGSKRQRCSGSSGREDCSRSDSTHDRLFIETKLKASNATITLFDETRKLARLEGKVPVLLLAKKNRPGFLVCLDSDDLAVVVSEYAAARVIEGEPGDRLEGQIRTAFLRQRGEAPDDDENTTA